MPLLDLNPPKENFRYDVLLGLGKLPKQIPPKFLYDKRGSELFEEICATSEYYPTRTEISILKENAANIAKCLGPRCFLYEFGSGASVKSRLLLEKMEDLAAYAPIDISKSMLTQTSEEIERDYPSLEVVSICADFSQRIELPNHYFSKADSKAAFFPGSTIGNLSVEEAVRFLERTLRLVGAGGRIVVGVDLIKDRDILTAAYNDSQGHTAAFNLNLLIRINRELDADFDLERFRHLAIFNEAQSRMEMHLKSIDDQRIRVSGHIFEFCTDETIHTECSKKYSPGAFEKLAARAGCRVLEHWTDPKNWFAVYVLTGG